ncbi:late embryogenesis abundant protein 32-like [Coffea arabica]|uniref:Late embryogenesis abundant protein 32-like n=1 Tax=Coffea arabica TaxID=13443 RepID=A0A6P6XJS3_COFAR|nr:late embryogenesis abundant protein D-34-like [Coffea arabica]XP_027127244.1 late embryogenesis abundant protein D-34-like [Coffea arabica]
MQEAESIVLGGQTQKDGSAAHMKAAVDIYERHGVVRPNRATSIVRDGGVTISEAQRATSKFIDDKPVTREAAEGVIGAETRDRPDMTTHPGGVAASAVAAAGVNKDFLCYAMGFQSFTGLLGHNSEPNATAIAYDMSQSSSNMFGSE